MSAALLPSKLPSTSPIYGSACHAHFLITHSFIATSMQTTNYKLNVGNLPECYLLTEHLQNIEAQSLKYKNKQNRATPHITYGFWVNSQKKCRNDARQLNVCFKYFEAIKGFVYITVTCKCSLSTIYVYIEKQVNKIKVKNCTSANLEIQHFHIAQYRYSS